MFDKYMRKIPFSRFLNEQKSSLEEPNFKYFLQQAKDKMINTSIKREKGQRLKLPPWLKTSIPIGQGYFEIEENLHKKGISTVCQEARCPNIGECWNDSEENLKTATIMILGDTCTRGCRFCSVKTARTPPPPNPNEPKLVAQSIKDWGVEYIVITTVDRDDLPDMGATQMKETVIQVKEYVPGILIECLVADYQGRIDCIEMIVDSGLDVFAHNIETVNRLQKFVRDPRANYQQSLDILRYAKEIKPSIITKSSIMVGFGETIDEVFQTMKDLRSIGVDCLTIGQYMQPTKMNAKVEEYVHPDIFEEFEKIGNKLGFIYTASGPLVRSSYKAGEYYLKKILKSRKNH